MPHKNMPFPSLWRGRLIRLLLPIAIGFCSMPIDAKPLQLPYLATQDVYMVYTDARFFNTSVFVNGVQLSLTNAGGQTFIVDGQQFSTAAGYHNQVNINGFLKPGSNIIEVHYLPSFIHQTQDEAEIRSALWEMFNHTVISKGKITQSKLGMESFELDELTANIPDGVDVLVNRLQRRFDKQKTESHKVVRYELELPEKSLVKASLENCDFGDDRSAYFKGRLLLNGIEIYEYEGNRQSYRGDWKESLKRGENSLTLKVDALEDGEAFDYTAKLSCNLRDLKRDTPIENADIDAGHLMDIVYLPFVNINVKSSGVYDATFYYDGEL